VIVIEGPDGSGKTTLCKMLLDKGLVEKVLPSPRIAAKGNVERMKFETDRYIRLHGENQKLAVDRLLFSEMAYGPVLRGRSAFSRAEYLTKLLELCLNGSMVIFCLPDKLTFKVDENPLVVENQERLKALYKALSEDSAFAINRTYIYKWDEPNSFKLISRWIKENR
jgi:hypothetical protein